MGERTTEFVLGLIGGILGFLGALLALMIGGVASTLGQGNMVVKLGWSAVVFSILGIIGASIVKRKHKTGGWFMIISSVGGVISISWFYSLSFILLLIAGILGVRSK